MLDNPADVVAAAYGLVEVITVAPVIQGGGASTLTAAVFITDIAPTSTGNVGGKTYVAGTLPANSVLSGATSDTDNVRVTVFVDCLAPPYTPSATVNTLPLTNLTLVSGRSYTGYVDIVLPIGGVVIATCTGANTATLTVVKDTNVPAAYSVVIGAYPGAQTAFKAGDAVTITAEVDNSAGSASIQASGIVAVGGTMVLGVDDSAGAGKKTATFTGVASNTAVSAVATVIPYSAIGTAGTSVDSASVVMDQVLPTIGAISVAYPGGQGALKTGEVAQVTAVVANQTSISYTSSAALAVTSPSVYQSPKAVTCAGGTTVVSGTNFTITATRASNGAVVVSNGLVKIENIAPSATLSLPAGNLGSGPGTKLHAITVTPTMPLSGYTLSTDLGSISGNNIQIVDATARITGTLTANLTGLSGLTATVTLGFQVGGFDTRTLVMAAHSQIAPIGISIANIAKTHAAYSGGSALTLYANVANHSAGYTITNAGGVYTPTGAYLWLSDIAFAGANTSGTLQVDISEDE